MNSINLCLISSRHTRAACSRIKVVCLTILFGIGISGCAETNKTTSESTLTRIKNLWLKSHVVTDVTRSGLNEKSGLFEVDATLRIEKLEAGRDDGYRLVARTCYYKGSQPEPVDLSDWSELLMEPGRSIPYASTSLAPADRCIIEIAYPKEVGLR